MLTDLVKSTTQSQKSSYNKHVGRPLSFDMSTKGMSPNKSQAYLDTTSQNVASLPISIPPKRPSARASLQSMHHKTAQRPPPIITSSVKQLAKSASTAPLSQRLSFGGCFDNSNNNDNIKTSSGGSSSSNMGNNAGSNSSNSSSSTPNVQSNNHFLTKSERYLSKHKLHPGFLAKYSLGEELGHGGFGFVVSARVRNLYSHPKYPQEVAVKFIFKEKMVGNSIECKLGIVPVEIAIVYTANHDNIVKFVDYFEDEMFFYLVTELHGTPWEHERTNRSSSTSTSIGVEPMDICSQSSIYCDYDESIMQSPPTPPQSSQPLVKRRSRCDLFECIEHHSRLTEKQAKYVFRQIVSAIYYLHSKGIVHRDIKDENILVDHKFKVKLIDFGSATIIPKSKGKTLFGRFLGTVQYASPEVLLGERYCGVASEIWAAGCCLYVMLNGSVPFETPNQAIYQKYTEPVYELSPAVYDLLDWMLEKKADSRATIVDVYNHDWLSC